MRKKKKVPRLKTDKQTEAFLSQDLSKLDFPQFKPVHFEFEKKEKPVKTRGSRQ
jgi:predicted DNA binding CopG/RHH family protein